MAYDPVKHHRRSIRLSVYDYAQAGAYFVTIVTQGRARLFGEVRDGRVRLNDVGKIAEQEWLRSADVRREVDLDTFVIMRNHIHGVVVIRDVGAHGRAPLPTRQRQPRSLGSFIAGFKSAATKRINAHRGAPGERLWQRNYYEHVVRGDRELDAIREYIVGNPHRWPEDPENPDVVPARGRAPVPA